MRPAFSSAALAKALSRMACVANSSCMIDPGYLCVPGSRWTTIVFAPRETSRAKAVAHRVRSRFRRLISPVEDASGRPISRILSGPVCGFTPVGVVLADRPVRSSLWAVYPRLERSGPLHCLCLTLLPTGVAWPPALLQTPVVSYTTFSSSPRGIRRSHLRLSFSVARSDRSLRPEVSPAPRPMEYGLTSTAHGGMPRSPGRPEALSSYTRGRGTSTLVLPLWLTVGTEAAAAARSCVLDVGYPWIRSSPIRIHRRGF